MRTQAPRPPCLARGGRGGDEEGDGDVPKVQGPLRRAIRGRQICLFPKCVTFLRMWSSGRKLAMSRYIEPVLGSLCRRRSCTFTEEALWRRLKKRCTDSVLHDAARHQAGTWNMEHGP